MTCTPKDCSKCEESEWSEWTDCTHKCNGESKRFRNYYGKNCKNNQTFVEKKECKECACTVEGVTYPEGHVFNNPNNKCEECRCDEGYIRCYPNCSENKETCTRKSDDEYVYTWYPPTKDECCGTCNKTKRGGPDKCDVINSVPRYYNVSNCVSAQPVAYSYCGGSCHSFDTTKLRFKNKVIGEKECRCCSAEKVAEETVEMLCYTETGIVKDYAILYKVLSCKCNMCHGESTKVKVRDNNGFERDREPIFGGREENRSYEKYNDQEEEGQDNRRF